MSNYQTVKNYLTDDNTTPAFVVENYENWTLEDAVDLARQLSFVTDILEKGGEEVSEEDTYNLVGELLFKVAGALGEVKAAEREAARREKLKREQEEKERLRKEEEKLAKKNREKMAALPLTLQPTLPNFDEGSVREWFENAKRVYAKYSIKEDDLHMYVLHFLPPYARGKHEELQGKPWGEYVEAMVKAFQSDNSMSAVMGNLMNMRPRENETYRAFAHRLYSASRRANPPLPEKEVCRIMLKILPHSVASLLVGRSCDQISDFIQILEDAITDRNMIEAGSMPSSFEKGWKDEVGNLKKLVESKEEKILATVSSLAEEKFDTFLKQFKELGVESNAMFVGNNTGRGRGGNNRYNGRGGRGNFRFRGNGNSMALRMVIARYVFEHWDDYKDFIIGFNKWDYFTLHTHQREMASEVQMHAAADALEISIKMIVGKEIKVFRYKFGKPLTSVVLNFEGPIASGHIDAMVPIETFKAYAERSGKMAKALHACAGSGGLQLGTKLSAVRANPTPGEWTPVGRGSRQPQAAEPRERSAVQMTADVVTPGGNDPKLTRDEVAAREGGDQKERLQSLIRSHCYDESDLHELMKINWDEPIVITGVSDCFPIKVKINGHTMIGLVDEDAACSVMAPSEWLKKEKIQTMRARIEYNGKQEPGLGIFNPLVKVSSRVKETLPMLVARLPPGIELVLGRNFLSKFKGKFAKASDTYSFENSGFHVSKDRAKLWDREKWEILELSDGDDIGRLFRVKIKIDGLEIKACLDLGACKSVLNTKYCTNTDQLKEVKIKLRVANKTYLPVHGVYHPNVSLGESTVKHPMICADLPYDIDALIGNDFMYKYKAVISWQNETAQFTIGGKKVILERERAPYEAVQQSNTVGQNGMFSDCPSPAGPSTGLLDRTLGPCLLLFAAEEIILPPNSYTMIKVCTGINKNILPAISTPMIVDDNPDIVTMECLILDELRVPILNNSDEEFCLQKGTEVGLVEPEDQNVSESKITETNLAEIKFALENNLIELDEIDFISTDLEKRGSTAEKPLGRILWDSRKLNATLVLPQYKSTTIQDVLAYCSDKKLLCSLDIVSYFYCVEMTEQSRKLCGFNFQGRSLVWNRLPMGTSASPMWGNMIMSKILLETGAMAYMDDIVCAGTSYQETKECLEATLQKLRENNLCVNPSKAVLFRKTIPILGLLVTAGEEARPDPRRFKPLLALENPKNPKELKSVICFFSYHRRYIKGFGAKIQKYHDMANEKLPFAWTEEDRKFIVELYTFLLQDATLALFDEKLDTRLHIDASKDNIGGFLAQLRNGRWKTVGYFSEPIKGTHLNWSAFHKECLALFKGVKYFENELKLLQKFTVVTDASSLRYLLRMDNPAAPFNRFIAYLSQFSFDFIIVRSEANKIPDALSRLPPPPKDSTEEVKLPDNLITKLQCNHLSPEKVNKEVGLVSPAGRTSVIQSGWNTNSCSPEPGKAEVDPMISKAPQERVPITSFRGEFDFLSNFYPVKIFYDACGWPSVEHAFQAAKTHDEAEKEWIRCAESPSEANRRGKQVTLRPDWEEIKVTVMLNCLMNKFTPETTELRKLLDTGDREIIENNYFHDNFWGNCTCIKCVNTTGENVLGQLLMIIRDQEKKSQIEEESGPKEYLIAPMLTRAAKKKLNDARYGGKDANAGDSRESAVTSDDCHRGDPRLCFEPVADDERKVLNSMWKNKDLLQSDLAIAFDSTNKEYEFLSPFHVSEFEVDGERFISLYDLINKYELRSLENQAFVNETSNELVRSIRLKMENAVKKSITNAIRKGLEAKFGNDSDLRKKLKATEGKLLVYCNHSCDNFTGSCLCINCSEKEGKNVLGIELMKLRNYFIAEDREESVASEMGKVVENKDRLKVPGLKRFIKLQREDPSLAKIIATFHADGKPTEMTPRIKNVPKFKMRQGLLCTNTKPTRTVVPKSRTTVSSCGAAVAGKSM
ncbi:Retrovirus-related Pol polyprotein from transposon 412 [Frankliniella fusca]|uniref:RNA-directed DNA polymerase n=1 Tax=Frankliniella fusca TaxID=407009 RepID=A0AAE1HU50_9NEOP|nr:Retrovirus-related Pol polyprotein from transposon 412 [Frankliniella fusca]